MQNVIWYTWAQLSLGLSLDADAVRGGARGNPEYPTEGGAVLYVAR